MSQFKNETFVQIGWGWDDLQLGDLIAHAIEKLVGEYRFEQGVDTFDVVTNEVEYGSDSISISFSGILVGVGPFYDPGAGCQEICFDRDFLRLQWGALISHILEEYAEHKYHLSKLEDDDLGDHDSQDPSNLRLKREYKLVCDKFFDESVR
jgi:hypothetical protein